MPNICKRFLQVAVALALAAACLVVYLFRGTGRAVPVLNYHQINDIDRNVLTVTAEQFEAQMRYLFEEGYQAITPDEMLDAWENGAPLPERPVVITFDDGYADNYRNAFPVLRRYGMKATIFLITDYVSLYPKYLTWEQVQDMQQSGMVNFGSHTLSHMTLTEAGSPQEIRHQLEGSKQAIEWRLKKPVQMQ